MPVDHTQQYVVAEVSGEVVPLGGFSTPDPYPFATATRPASVDAPSLRESALALARVLDPNGHYRQIIPVVRDGAWSELVNYWRETAPADWPADSIAPNASGGWRVVTTGLSQERSYAGAWTAIAYTFDFDPSGALTRWSVRMSEQFASR
jgi:hypothetical protein